MTSSGAGRKATELEDELILSAIHGNQAARDVLVAADQARPVTLSDAALIDLYWHTTGDDWAIPEDVMVRYARAVIEAALGSAK
jgi:hypothetical protein